MADCPHGMPTPGSCVDCMDEGNLPPARRAPLEVVSTFTARYDGHCSGCNLGIHIGQSTVKLTDDSYRHAGCAPRPRRYGSTGSTRGLPKLVHP